MEKNSITKGDLVEVSWEHLEGLRGRVVDVPCAPGDNWIIRCECERARAHGRLFYVGSYSLMELIPETNP